MPLVGVAPALHRVDAAQRTPIVAQRHDRLQIGRAAGGVLLSQEKRSCIAARRRRLSRVAVVGVAGRASAAAVGGIPIAEIDRALIAVDGTDIDVLGEQNDRDADVAIGLHERAELDRPDSSWSSASPPSGGARNMTIAEIRGFARFRAMPLNPR